MRAKTPRTSLNKLSSLNVGAVKIEDTIHYNGAKWLTIHLIKIYMDKTFNKEVVELQQLSL